MLQNAFFILYNTRRVDIALLSSIDDITLLDVSFNESNNILNNKNDSNDFTRSAIVTSSSLKIVVIKNTRDSSAEKELFIISLSAIINMSENSLILANIELSLARELEDIKEISSVNNTSLDINPPDLVILSRSILIIER